MIIAPYQDEDVQRTGGIGCFGFATLYLEQHVFPDVLDLQGSLTLSLVRPQVFYIVPKVLPFIVESTYQVLFLFAATAFNTFFFGNRFFNANKKRVPYELRAVVSGGKASFIEVRFVLPDSRLQVRGDSDIKNIFVW